MSHDIYASKFRDIGVIVHRSMLDRHKKELLLLDITGTSEELVIALKEILDAVRTVIEDLTFFLIRSIVCIYL